MNSKDAVTIVGYFIYPFIVFILGWIVLYSGVYVIFPWFDILMHIIGGASVAITYFLILNFLQKKNYIRLNILLRIIFVISLVALTAIAWEFFEFILEFYTGFSFQGDLNDTMEDFFFGLMGGLIASLSLEMYFQKNKVYLKSK